MNYNQLKTAIERFGQMLEAYQQNEQRPPLEREAVQDSLVKRFEYTLEIAWKTCKRHLEEEGFAQAATGSPKSIVRLAAQNALISDPEAWIRYLAVRRDTLYDCSSDKAEAILDIAEVFYRDVVNLYQAITGEPDVLSG